MEPIRRVYAWKRAEEEAEEKRRSVLRARASAARDAREAEELASRLMGAIRSENAAGKEHHLGMEKKTDVSENSPSSVFEACIAASKTWNGREAAP